VTGPWTNASRWPLVGLGKVAEVKLGKMLQPRPAQSDDQPTPYLRAGSLAELDDLGELPTMFASPKDRRSYAVAPRDLIIAEGGDVGRSEFVPEVPRITIIQNSLHRVRPHPAVAEARFVKYALEAIYLSDWLDVVCNKSTFGHLTLEKARSLPLPLPPKRQQRAIADFLDTETVRIDALTAKKQLLVQKAAERVQALIESRTWNTSEPELGLNRLVARFVDYRGATPEKAKSGIPLATAGHIKEGRLELETDSQFVSDDVYRSWMRRGFPALGDVLMTMEAPLGQVAQVDCLPLALAQRVILMKPDERFISGDYLAFLLRSPSFQARLAASATGSTALGIRADRLKALRLPVLPRQEQNRVVAEVDEAEATLHKLTESLAKQMGLLREHRQALITAAVTGEFEVPGVAA
jgi:type I restriction enzyme, S subunit